MLHTEPGGQRQEKTQSIGAMAAVGGVFDIHSTALSGLKRDALWDPMVRRIGLSIMFELKLGLDRIL